MEIPAGDHDLQLIAEDGTLEQWIQRVVGGLSRPVSIESNGDGLPRRDSADGELLAGIEVFRTNAENVMTGSEQILCTVYKGMLDCCHLPTDQQRETNQEIDVVAKVRKCIQKWKR